MFTTPKGTMSVPYGTTRADYASTLAKQGALTQNLLKYTILEVVNSIPFPDKKAVFNIGDYGTFDGTSSMTLIRDLLVSVKEQHGPDIHFQVIYEDKETNDFNSLFKHLMGLIPDPPSYLLELENVYPLVSGMNYTKQCVPDDSMHIIMSWYTIQWLSAEVTFKESLWVYPGCNEEEKEALKKQAQMDYESFLLLRSKELKHGGVIVIGCPGVYADNHDTIQFNHKIFIYMLIDVWRSFRQHEKITHREYAETNFPMYFFGLKDILSPFQDPNSQINKCGLHLHSADVIHPPCVFYGAWKVKKELQGIDDRQEFARSYVTANRNWSNNLFLAGLSDSRTLKEKEEIVDDLFHTVEGNISLMDPEEFKNGNVLTYAIVRKT